MEDSTIPSSLIGAITFFLLLGIIAFVVIKETVKVILKPALVIVGLAIVAVWAGILDQTVVGSGFEWIGDRLLAGLEGVSSWVADSWEARTGDS
jgi:energy-converting hydrogenase Eha subunit C